MKKAIFFTIDAIIGIAILFIAFLIISSTHESTDHNIQIELQGKDILDFLSSTKIQDLNNDDIFNMWREGGTGDIQRKDNTILEQLGRFHYDVEDAKAENLARLSLGNFLPNNIQIIINSTTIINEQSTPIDDAAFIISSKELFYGIVSNSELYGPYIAEVKVWQ